jgi:alpha-amylase
MTTPKRYLHLYFQVHQPRRLRMLRFLDLGSGPSCFDDKLNKSIMRRVADHCYIPVNALMLRLIDKFPQLRISYSISGVALEQMEKYSLQALESFKILAKTGAVEFMGETYYHSLASVKNKEEFAEQVMLHKTKLEELLGVSPTFFRNTELIYADEIGKWIKDLGYEGTLIDGIDRLTKLCSPHHIYAQPATGLKLLLRDYKLSDDIAFRYADIHWKGWPLTAKKYLGWLKALPASEQLINLGMDYETFGEHQHEITGIFRFLEELISGIVKEKGFVFLTASEAIQRLKPKGKLRVKSFISWADSERDLSAWLGNDMQQDAFDTLFGFEEDVKQLNDAELLSTWRYLQSSDHFYYMSTKTGADGIVHNSFSPYASPHEAFVNYMNALTDFSIRLQQRKKPARRNPRNVAGNRHSRT